MKFRHCYNASFRWSAGLLQRKVQGFLELKKEHPCGSKSWKVLRVGMDFRMKCEGCGHELMLPRSKVEKSIKKIKRPGEAES